MDENREIIIGTRGSALALWQTNWVKDKLAQLLPEYHFKVVRIRTKGDKISDAPLAKIGSKGIFVREIEYALLRKEIDMAVHSMKDLPTTLPDGLTIGAITERIDPSDALISYQGYNPSNLPLKAKIGSSSLRRRAQLLHHRPDLQFENLRGNVDTRIAKLKSEGFDAIVLASAGVKRLNSELRKKPDVALSFGNPDKTRRLLAGQSHAASLSFQRHRYGDFPTQSFEKLTIAPLSYEICLPAVGQGAIGVEVREKDAELLEILKGIDHFESHATITAERTLLESLGGGCQIPIAGLGTINDGTLSLEGLVADVDGNRVIRSTASGKPEEAKDVGRELAKILIDMGAKSLLE